MNKIKWLVLDVDGTLTDGSIHIGESGEVFKSFNVKDGFAISQMLPYADITPIILTGRESKIVENRMRELSVSWVIQGITNKAVKLEELALENGFSLDEVAYVGDELNDYEAMKLCGFKACPIDAVNEIRAVCDYVSRFEGGQGAIRDICEHLLKKQGKWESFLGMKGIRM